MAERDWYRIVLDGPCPQCGFDATGVEGSDLGPAVVAEAQAWVAVLDEPVELLTRLPGRGSWSALAYACHTRDVLAVFADRIELARVEDGAVFGWWDHEAAAVDEAYDDQDPGVVAAELRDRAEELRRILASVEDSAWGRTGTRRPGEDFTVDGLARFALHEAHHHRLDAEAGAAASAT